MDARIEAFTERLNPIIVKEIRQGLRTRIFWICFGLMLLACFVISLVAYGTTVEDTVSRAGPSFFYSYFLCLGVVQFFIIPYSAYRSLAREREEETWVLLSLTGIGAKRILRGKLGSFLVQALLYGSAVLPFLLFSYYLNGIDLPTILVVVLLGAAFVIFLTCISVCAATLAESRLARGLVHFLLLGVLLAGCGLGLGAAAAITFENQRLINDPEFLVVVIGSLWAMLTFGNLMFQAAAARLALPTEDYARGPRVALLLQFAGSVGLILWGWFEEGRDHEIAMVGQMGMLATLFVVGVFFLAGDESIHEVHFRRKGFPLFRPGSLPAYRFLVLIAGGVTAIWATVYGLSPDLKANPEPGMYFIFACVSYLLIYLALPIIVARLSGVWALNTSVGLRALTVALVVAGCGLPPLIGLVIGMKADDELLNLFNPLVGLVNWVDRPWDHRYKMGAELLFVLGSVAFALTLVADRMLSGRERESRKERTEAREGVAAPAGS